ncbi:MAG: hypothetical protein WAK26_09485 [Terracidiphilus sp.]
MNRQIVLLCIGVLLIAGAVRVHAQAVPPPPEALSPAVSAPQDATPATAATPVMAAPEVPLQDLSKDQLARLEKRERNQYKDCTSPKKNPQAAGAACAAVADALQAKLGDAAMARSVRQRSCTLGNEGGCISYGKAFEASGDLVSARNVWAGGVCASSNACKEVLFYSYANAQQPDLAMAEQFGLPLCEQFDNDPVCKRLVELGSTIDYAGIQERRRQKQIAALNSQISTSDLAIPVLTAEVAVAQAVVDRCSGFIGCGIANVALITTKNNLASAQASNAALHQQRDALVAGAPGQ